MIGRQRCADSIIGERRLDWKMEIIYRAPILFRYSENGNSISANMFMMAWYLSSCYVAFELPCALPLGDRVNNEKVE